MNRISQPLIIQANMTNLLYWQDLWRYRELLYFLAWRDVLVRYKQTVIGIAWALLRPFISMVVFTIVFGVIAQLPSQGVPYPILVFSGMLPWQFFSSALIDSSNSLVNNSNMISKVYFPRLLVPLSSVIVNFIDFLVAGMILLGLMIWYDFIPSWQILAFPLCIILVLALSIGAGLWFAALNVEYRDFRYIVPFIVQFGLYISPVGFSSEVVPGHWKLLFYLNPMVGIINGFRWSIIGANQLIDWKSLVISLILSFIFFGTGIWYFRGTEQKFADKI